MQSGVPIIVPGRVFFQIPLSVVDYLDEISSDDLHDALDDVAGEKPPRRMLAAIAYKRGVTQIELAEQYDTGRRTIDNWLELLDTDDSLEQVVTEVHFTEK